MACIFKPFKQSAGEKVTGGRKVFNCGSATNESFTLFCTNCMKIMSDSEISLV